MNDETLATRFLERQVENFAKAQRDLQKGLEVFSAATNSDVAHELMGAMATVDVRSVFQIIKEERAKLNSRFHTQTEQTRI